MSEGERERERERERGQVRARVKSALRYLEKKGLDNLYIFQAKGLNKSSRLGRDIYGPHSAPYQKKKVKYRWQRLGSRFGNRFETQVKPTDHSSDFS